MRLSPAEQCRVRDRSTIMARQLYAERGDDFADAQARCPLPALTGTPVPLQARAARLAFVCPPSNGRR